MEGGVVTVYNFGTHGVASNNTTECASYLFLKKQKPSWREMCDDVSEGAKAGRGRGVGGRDGGGGGRGGRGRGRHAALSKAPAADEKIPALRAAAAAYVGPDSKEWEIGKKFCLW